MGHAQGKHGNTMGVDGLLSGQSLVIPCDYCFLYFVLSFFDRVRLHLHGTPEPEVCDRRLYDLYDM